MDSWHIWLGFRAGVSPSRAGAMLPACTCPKSVWVSFADVGRPPIVYICSDFKCKPDVRLSFLRFPLPVGCSRVTPLTQVSFNTQFVTLCPQENMNQIFKGKMPEKKNRNQVPPKAVTKSPLELPFEANFYYKYLPQLRYVILSDVDCMTVCNIHTASRSFIPAAYETTSIFGLCRGVVPP